jgi:predicted O-methyltransferase YrrM
MRAFLTKLISLQQYWMLLDIKDRNSYILRFLGPSYSLGHLRHFKERAAGPVQRDEALLLYAIVKTIDPKTVVEFGFMAGHSAVNFLKAMSIDARLYSYDISGSALQLAEKVRDRRFVFVCKSQADFDSSDVENRRVDLAFFDASHNYDLNVATFERLSDSLSERALVIVHDTGTWHGDLKGFRTADGYFIGDSAESGYVHRPGERKFVNYIRETRPDFDQIHLHSTTKLRHGLTLMQRNASELAL